MAKEKQTRRMMAMALAAAVTMSSVPVVAFAEEGGDIGAGTPAATTTTETTVSSDGTKTETTTTTQPTEGSGTQESPTVEKNQVVVTITPSGSDTPSSTETTDTTDTSWSETTDNSSTSFEEHKENKVTVENNADGTTNTTTENTVEGEQTTVTDTDENNDTTQPDVTVQMIPGQTTTGYGEADPVITGPDPDTTDGNWDYTVTDTATREVTVTTGTVTTTETPVSDTNLESLGPDYVNDGGQDLPDNVDYTLAGWTTSNTKIKIVNIIYERDEATGEILKDEKGNYMYREVPEGNTGASLIYLENEAGERVYTYCVDEDTPTYKWTNYVVENLNDATYFKYNDAKDNLRSIAMNGYWGEPDYAQNEDGTQASTPSTGSVAYAKANMLEAIKDGKLNFSYDGVDYSSTTEEGKTALRTMVEALTADELMAATQAAIWSCANGHVDAMHGIDGEAVKSISSNNAAVFYHYLLGLPGTEKNETTVIDQDSFLAEDGLSITIGEQATLKEGDTRNTDDNDKNDVYNADISFKMVVTPGENDDMIVTLVDNSDNVIRQARIAGTNKEGETYDILTAVDGKYTFKDLPLQENSNTTFDLRLEGVQYLEQGVYIYKHPSGNYEAAQTLISVAEGTRDFDVHTTFNVQFDVDENDRTVVKRSWRSYRITTDDNKGGSNGNDPVDPVVPVDPTEIPEEEVPQADAPVEDDGMVAGAGEDIEDDGMVAGEEDENAADAEDDGLVAGAEDEIIAATADSNHMAGAGASMFAALAGLFMLGRKKKTN